MNNISPKFNITNRMKNDIDASIISGANLISLRKLLITMRTITVAVIVIANDILFRIDLIFVYMYEVIRFVI